MDNLDEIRQLLEKFYDGTSNLSEEELLIRFFQSDDIPPGMEADSELFKALATSSNDLEVPEDLNSKIASQIAAAEHSEAKTRRINLFAYSGLAAGLLIILSVYLGFIRDNGTRLDQYAVDDPDLAYVEARQALEYVSSKWNRATGELANLNEVSNTMKTMRTINKLSTGSRELNLLGNLRKADKIEVQ